MYGEVFVTLNGAAGQTDRLTMKPPFMGGKTQDFKYSRGTIGHITSMQLETFSPGEAWKADRIIVLPESDSDGGGMVYLCKPSGPISASSGSVAAPTVAKFYKIPNRAITGPDSTPIKAV